MDVLRCTRALVKIESGRDEVGRALVTIKSGRAEVGRALVQISNGRDEVGPPVLAADELTRRARLA